MYEPTCDLCLFHDLCSRPTPCSNFTPVDEELQDVELVERGRQQFYDEWEQYLYDED